MSFDGFSVSCSLLPAFTKPQADELLSSWLTRMAYDHGLTTKELCKYIWPNYSGNPDIDRTICTDEIAILAARTNCSVAEVNATTLSSFKHTLFAAVSLLYGQERWLIPSKRKKRGHCSGLMFCATCLKIQPYYKKQWRLALSFACTHCGCFLSGCCPHCGNGNSFIDCTVTDFANKTIREYMLECHHCGKDVTNSVPDIAPPVVVRLQQKLYDIIEHGLHETVVYTESYFRVLHHVCELLMAGPDTSLKIKRFSAYVFRLHGTPPQRYNCKPFELRFMNVKQRADIIAVSYWLLQDWPYRFIEHALTCRLKRSDVLGELSNAPYWFWEGVYYGMSPHAPIETERFVVDEDRLTAKPKTSMPVRLDYDHNVDEYYYNDVDAIVTDDEEDNTFSEFEPFWDSELELALVEDY